MDAAALARLLSPTGWQLLGTLPPYEPDRVLALSEKLQAEGHDPELVAAALTQSRLRTKARAKFGEFAAGMVFTPDGLEQATRLPVAAHHARRFRDAGVAKVADITCGIGADTMAMASMGLDVLAVDIDELTAAVATVNVRHFDTVEVRHGDGTALDFAGEGVDAVFADPARRTRSGARRHHPAGYAPPLDAVLALRDRVPSLGVKVAPGIAHRDLPPDAETQWVSVDGEVVEAGLWFGKLAETTSDDDGSRSLRSALALRGGKAAQLHGDGSRGQVGPLEGYLAEPDGAVIRAGLVGTLAARLGAHLVDPTIAYLTLPTPPEPTILATTYRVLDTMPFSLKRLKAYLRQRGVGRVTIKKRGTAVVPEQLRSQLDLRGDGAATVVLTRVAGGQTVLIVEPV